MPHAKNEKNFVALKPWSTEDFSFHAFGSRHLGLSRYSNRNRLLNFCCLKVFMRQKTYCALTYCVKIISDHCSLSIDC